MFVVKHGDLYLKKNSAPGRVRREMVGDIAIASRFAEIGHAKNAIREMRKRLVSPRARVEIWQVEVTVTPLRLAAAVTRSRGVVSDHEQDVV